MKRSSVVQPKALSHLILASLLVSSSFLSYQLSAYTVYESDASKVTFKTDPTLCKLNLKEGEVQTTNTDSQTRSSYNCEINQLKKQLLEHSKAVHLKHQSISEQAAVALCLARNEVKRRHQRASSTFGRFAIAVRNLFKYGSISGPECSLKAVQKKGAEESAYAAVSTGGENLGLSNNGFRKIRKVYKIIKKRLGSPHKTGYFPEVISAEQAKCFLRDINQKDNDGKNQPEAIKLAIKSCEITSLYAPAALTPAPSPNSAVN